MKRITILEVSTVAFVLSLLICTTYGYFGSQSKLNKNDCFCRFEGVLDDCSCSADTVDYFNNIKVFPILRSLLHKDYFRFYRVNLKKKCPFWTDDSRCAIKYCHVEPCLQENIPEGLKGRAGQKHHFQPGYSERSSEPQTSDCDADHDSKLGYLNMTISKATFEEFARWKAYDDAVDNYCVTMDDDTGAEYVDLLFNPERYTGYKGKSAHRIWNSIYTENCFRPKNSYYAYIESAKLNGMCLEKRAFYRVVSGLHASINIHLCSNYLLSENMCFLPTDSEGEWGPNLVEFQRRFDPEMTNGEGPQWLQNLYFLYLLELRALQKATPYLLREEYFTGNIEDDADVRSAIKTFLDTVGTFPDHFDETSMFIGGKQANKLKEEFRQHFRNISRIMDCVGCDKCKLWGKLQIHGLGTALKILFSGKFDNMADLSHTSKSEFQLERSEIVALVNGFGRLSSSILELEHFRSIMR